MQKITVSSEYFNAADTLLCGQLFRFSPSDNGYFVVSGDKACRVATENGFTAIECEDKDKDYFYRYFDLGRDYSAIVARAKSFGGTLSVAAELGKGVRILNQNAEEALFSFVVSQNNNIPRIKGIIERLCAALGEEKTFCGVKYRSFPAAEVMALENEEFYRGIGLGYRAPFIKRLAESVASGETNTDEMRELSAKELKNRLLKIYGVGRKVADCVSLFGFHRSDAFPVDVWIEKVYRENFCGTLTDREKISEWFVSEFGEDSGFFQQYLFYYKRSLEKNLRRESELL